jgi:hypothetical protein
MKASRRLAENDIITRGITVKIQQVAVRRNYKNQTNDAKGEEMSRADRNPWLVKMPLYLVLIIMYLIYLVDGIYQCHFSKDHKLC